MTDWLLDTNVISELRKPNCDPAVRFWSESQRPEQLYLSTVTLAEIRLGIDLLRDADRRRALTAWLNTDLRSWFAGRILEIDEDVILIWRTMVEAGRSRGITYSQPDLFIAATAKCHDLTVVTRNIADFVQVGVDVFDPWTD